MKIDEEELVKKFIFEIGRSPTLLTVALNFIMKYEFDEKQKININKLLIKLNPFSYWDFNLTDNSQFLLNQYFNLEIDEVITSWQITVNLLEIKNLIGVNEIVFCVVEIGDKKFTTKEKHIDKLRFDEDDSDEAKFIARIERQSLKTAFNSVIKISVYFKNFYPFSPTLVGKFQTDLGTIYNQPGHSVTHKWGEILSKNDLENDIYNLSSEFTLKGYIKFDISLKTDNDKNKIFSEEFKREDTDDIDK